MGILAFFKKLGKGLLKVVGFINKYVTDDVLEAAVGKALELGDNKLLNNETRRHQLVAFLMKQFHLNENMARWATETAVAKIKIGEDKLEEHFKTWVESHGDDDEPPTQEQPPAPVPVGSQIQQPAGLPQPATNDLAVPAGSFAGTGKFVPPVAGKDPV